MRKSRLHRLLFIVVFFFTTSVCLADIAIQKKTHPVFLNQLGFEQNFNIYKWLYGFDIDKEISPRSSVLVVQKFNSTLMRVNNNQKKWKDDELLTIDLSWKFSPKLIGKVMTSSIFFSDQLSDIKNDITTNSGSLALIYNPVKSFQMNSQIGYKFDDRFDKLDHGATYLFDIRMPAIDISDYRNSFRFMIDGDEYAVRKNRDLRIDYNVVRHFYLDTSDSLAMSWSKQRRDNYDQFDITNLSIESLNEQLGRFTNFLKYHVNDQVRIHVNSDISTRQTEVSRFNTNDLDISRSKHVITTFNEIHFGYMTKKISESLKFGYLTETQNNSFPDSYQNSPFSPQFGFLSQEYKSSRVSLANVLHLHFSPSDSMMTNFSISRYRYDTPDEDNYDDHDELRINAGISQIHHFNELMAIRLNLGINLKHLVFIFGERSADNNWMRIFRLSPEVVFVPTRTFQWVQSLEVLANYVDYDFDASFNPTDIRSYVFRKFSMQHVWRYQLSRAILLNLNYRLELEENGKLIWDRWKETIITTRRNHYVRASVDYVPTPSLTFSTGFVLYERKENFKIYESSVGSNAPNRNDYLSFGPSVKVIYAPHPRLNFLLTAIRRFIDRVEQNQYNVNNINLSLSWYL